MADNDTTTADTNADVMAVVEATDPVALQEPQPTVEPDHPVPPMPTAPEPPKRRGVFVPLVLGGALAAGAGFAVAQFVPDVWPDAGTAALQSQLAAQADETAALRAELAQLSATLAEAPAPDTALADRVAAVEGALSGLPGTGDLDQRLAAVESRLASLAELPVDEAASSVALTAELQSLRAEVDALKGSGATLSADIRAAADAAEARLAEAQAQAEALRAQAEAATASTLRRAALGRVQAALETGAPFAAALAELNTEIPAILTEGAETGIPSLTALQDSFPDAARAALEASLRANMGEGWADRVTAFLRSQTGARSLTPRDGADPDAVLSRAEAALHDGRLPEVLTELQALPPEGLAAMEDWIATANRRVAALDAVNALSAALE
jgi:hypothetical protein